MKSSEKIDKVLGAIAKVKREIVGVIKKSDNPFYKSKYADLNSYLDVVEPLFEANGLVMLQPLDVEDGNNIVETIIIHEESGQYISSKMKLVGETDMQKAGSAVTYGRRFTLGSVVVIKALDDDGNEASGKTDKKESKPVQSKFIKPDSTTKSSGFRKPKAKKEVQSEGEDW